MITQIETDKSRHSATTAKLILAALLTAGLAGCGSPASVSVDPSKPDGVYVIQDGRLGRLDEDSDKVVKTWQQRTSLSRDLNFLVIHESVATLPVAWFPSVPTGVMVNAGRFVFASSFTAVILKFRRSMAVTSNTIPVPTPRNAASSSVWIFVSVVN